ncbi:MAG: DNA-binding protein [Clostridia bacterium]|nr:DNA-binding protein [Clostridia bacterium]
MAQDGITRKVELAWLAAFYGGLLTEKEREALNLHCEEDMSLMEIAQATGVSRQGVHETLVRAAGKLTGMEDKLHLADRFRRMEEGLLQCMEELRSGHTDEAEKVLDALIRLEQEENNGL